MVGGLKQSLPTRISAAAAASRVDIDGNVSSVSETMFVSNKDGDDPPKTLSSDVNIGLGERALSAAGAAVVSAIIVNPLDVAKTRLQAQAAGFPNQGLCGTACLGTDMILSDLKHGVRGSEPLCASGCTKYKGTMDVFYKVTRQEGFGRLWRGTNASLALAVPTVGIYLPCYDIFRNLMEDLTTHHAPGLTPYVPLVAGSLSRSLACVTCYPVELARTRMQAFKETQNGAKPAGVWKTLVEMTNLVRGTNNLQKLQSYRVLWTGLGAQLARDVPFSAICWSTLEFIRRRILTLVDDEARATSVLGANFSAGFVAGSLAAALTCPLDVARTRRQIEKDPTRALTMTAIKTLQEVWRGISTWEG
ncbi:mitochondrial carrier protein MTM1 isoform X3 [Ricinus communis]|uniref:mitochondrial carrier protein MTM1 isoform X3 n=1 Tax=Ricinus communis TaxID=3988 RepID=UPI00201AE189|nr:mitochondrial carrier protein MTM1 isoform X3 [Ricinus communis]